MRQDPDGGPAPRVPRSVLVYSHSWLPGQVDGVAVRIMGHVRGLMDLGVKVTVVTPDFLFNCKDPNEPPRVVPIPATEHVTVPTMLQPVYRKNFCMAFHLKTLLKFVALLRRVSPDLVHATQEHGLILLAAACLYCNVPLVVSVHTDVTQIAAADPHFSRHGALHARVSVAFTNMGYRLWAAGGAAFFCVSRHAQAYLRAAGVPGAAVLPSPWGPMVDRALFRVDQPEAVVAAARRRLTFGLPGAFLLVYAGRVTAEKGIQFLVDALARGPSNVVLALIGPGSLAPELARLHGPERRLHCTGESISREAVAAAFRAADAAVSASQMETVGFTAMEALSCGTPMLAADAAGFAEHLGHGVNARLFVPGDAASYDRELAALMATAPKGNWSREALRASMESASVELCTQRALRAYQAARAADWRYLRLGHTLFFIGVQWLVTFLIN